jgi:hypothetical protein
MDTRINENQNGVGLDASMNLNQQNGMDARINEKQNGGCFG